MARQPQIVFFYFLPLTSRFIDYVGKTDHIVLSGGMKMKGLLLHRGEFEATIETIIRVEHRCDSLQRRLSADGRNCVY